MSRSVRSILAVLSLLSSVACAARAPRDASLSRCEGRRIVVVTNYWSRSIDIYTSTGAIIGIVDPGRQEEFLLPSSASYIYAVSSYRGYRQRVPRTAVQVRYRCD